MGTFQRKTFRSKSADAASTLGGRIGAYYRTLLARHPFLLFGLPFIGTIVAGSFVLTPATAMRYEAHDNKVKTLSKEEALGLSKDRRRLDMNEEYYVRFALPEAMSTGRGTQRALG